MVHCVVALVDGMSRGIILSVLTEGCIGLAFAQMSDPGTLHASSIALPERLARNAARHPPSGVARGPKFGSLLSALLQTRREFAIDAMSMCGNALHHLMLDPALLRTRAHSVHSRRPTFPVTIRKRRHLHRRNRPVGSSRLLLGSTNHGSLGI